MISCAACVYSVPEMSDKIEEGPLLFCHRYPATVIVIDGEVVQTHPEAQVACGEFTPRDI